MILVYFSRVLGFSTNPSTFKRLRNYTSKLSRLIYYTRLYILEAILLRFIYNSIR